MWCTVAQFGELRPLSGANGILIKVSEWKEDERLNKLLE